MGEKRKGNTLFFESDIAVKAYYSIGGKREGQGPVGEYFDQIFDDTSLGQKTWELAEGEMQKTALDGALGKLNIEKPDVILAGDLLNQCIASGYGLIEIDSPFLGLYGACSTMGEAMLLGSALVDGGFARNAAAVSSSHYCSAERQFRFPLAYGSMRPPTAQWTATASGATIIAKANKSDRVIIKSATIGKSTDYGITDIGNMGAAMAPAAASTLLDFFKDTNTTPADYDRIFTGDLGYEGSRLLYELMEEKGFGIEKNHSDCGMMIFDMEDKDVNCGGSGCGCSASVLCSYILKSLEKGNFKNILFMPTGAMMSPVSVQQGGSIPAVAHLLNIVFREE